MIAERIIQMGARASEVKGLLASIGASEAA